MIRWWDRWAGAAVARLEREENEGGAADPSLIALRGGGRHHELDGIRGWAALAVVIFHLFHECLGLRFPLFRNPLTHIFNGTFAVFVFFVLSGEALSASYFAGGGTRAIASLAVKRHSRLSIPIFASVLVLWLLQKAGLVFSGAAAPIVGRPDWLGALVTTPIGLADCFRYAIMNVYLFGAGGPQINPFLWTMSAEMVGSIFVFALLGCLAHLKRRTLVLGGLMLLLLAFNPTAFLGPFVAGLLFGSARQRGLFRRVGLMRWAQPASALAILGALIALDRLPLFGVRIYAVIAIALVGAIFVNRGATAFFRTRLSILLGKISFPLYLIHLAVIVSLTSWMIIRLSGRGMLDTAGAFAIGLVSVIAAIVAAIAFEPVELLTKRAGHALSDRFVAARTPG